MNVPALLSAQEYSARIQSVRSRFVVEALGRTSVEKSILAVWADSPYTSMAEGEVFFLKDFRLRMREELDFDAGLMTSYGYEVYRDGERLYW